MPPAMSARFVVITGLSGSGKSTALRALEDLGYYAVDNLPVKFLPAFVNLPLENLGAPFKAALVMDVRDPVFTEDFPRIYGELLASGYPLELLFLEASDEALLRRFSQTRRQHPLVGVDGGVLAGIHREKDLLAPCRDLATQVVDTSRFNLHQLRQEIIDLFSRLETPAGMHINLISFGFKYGLPPEADMVFDVRFMANPYFVDELRPLDGRREEVAAYIRKDDLTDSFLNRLDNFLQFVLPLYQRERRAQVTVAVGCTGGKHRSVMVAEWLARVLTLPGFTISLRHRDVELG